jgi:hypothetical protein
MRHAISCAVNFYNAGVEIQGRRIGSRDRCYDFLNIFADKLVFLTQNKSFFMQNFDRTIGF